MKKIVFLIFFYLFSNLVYSQDYLKLKMKGKRSRLIVGNTVGLTFKNDTLNFNHWKSISQIQKDSFLRKTLWMVERFENEKLVLFPASLTDQNLILDTIKGEDIKDEMYFSPSYRFQGEYYSNENPEENFIIVKRPDSLYFKTISFDSIASITFAENYKKVNLSIFETVLTTTFFTFGSVILTNSKDNTSVFVGSALVGSSMYSFYNLYKSHRKNKTKTFQLSDTKIIEKRFKKR